MSKKKNTESKSEMIDLIQQAKDTIGEQALSIIEDHLGISFNKGVSNCPFHDDSTPSFVWNPKTSTAKCFGCGRMYSILDYLVEVKGSYKNALDELFRMAHIEKDMYAYRPFGTDSTDWFENYKYPTGEKEPTEDNVIKYFAKRSIGVDTLKYAGVQEDKYGNIAFPFEDIDGKLIAVKYRKSRASKKGEAKYWWQHDADAAPILYNVKKVDYTKPLVITEGMIDTLSLIEAGYLNVVSIPDGATSISWLEFNFEFLQNFSTVVLYFDNDKAGQEGLSKTIGRIGEYRCRIVKPTPEDEQMVEDFYEQLGVSGIRKTDANNILLACGKDRLLQLISRAEEIPTKHLKYLLDCEVTNVRDMECMSTGLESLDDILYGNLFPCFTVYSGYAGSGKSSVCNLTSVIAPLETGHKVFIFSGELDEGQLLSWILSPLAGINHTRVWDNDGGRKGYSVTEEAENVIRKYYRENIILYEADDELETSDDKLLEAMEIAYRKYGCDTFLIDNMMCLTFNQDGADSKWDAQKRFIIKLMNFTKKYGVNTNLVLHPKKPAAGQTTTSTSDLAGSSDIGNLVHRLLWVSRLKDDEEGYSVQVEVIKDRPSQAAGDVCKLYYDKATRRLYSDVGEYKKKFSWEKEFKPNYKDNVAKNLMCNRVDIMSMIPRNNGYGCDQM